MTTVAVTDATFDAEVKNSDLPVVVDFWAEWCGPCKQIGPALEELAVELQGKVKIAKVDVDTNPSAAASMGVRGIPALFIFKDGEVVSNRAGAAPKAALQSLDSKRSSSVNASAVDPAKPAITSCPPGDNLRTFFAVPLMTV